MSDFAVVVAASGPNVAIDLAQSRNWVVTLTSATVNLCITNTPRRQRSDLFVVLKQDATGGRVTKWSAASPATVSTEPTVPQPTDTNGILVHLITLDGVQWFNVGSGPALTSATLAVAFTATTVTVASNAGTVPVTAWVSNFTNSSAATMAITMATTGAVDGQVSIVRIYDFSGVAQTIGWTNTENSTVTAPTTSAGSTTLPLTVTFMFNGATSKWRTIESV